MKTNIVLLSLAALAGLAALRFSAPEVLETRVFIDASPQQVWAVLADSEHYGEWNPVMVRLSGSLRAGETIEFENRMGERSMVFRPTLLAAQPGRELRWLGHLGVRGLFDGEHFFVLRPAGGGTELLHGERFSGALVPLVRGWLRGGLREDFGRINAALKVRAESLAR